MKKNYFSTLFAALMLFVAMPAMAQVSTIADLYGKYQFTATITPTEAGQNFTDYWASECEVTIASETFVSGENQVDISTSISGFLGATQELFAGELDANKCEFYVGEPNPSYGLLDPYNYAIGIADPEHEMKDFKLTFKYDPETKEITVPDFSICTFTFPDGTMTVDEELAKVTNVKMTPLKKVANLSGEWYFVPEGKTEPAWRMTLTSTDESYKTYDVSLTYSDFAPVTLAATFNGRLFSIALNNNYLDSENNIYLADANGMSEETSWDFELTGINELSLIYGIAIMKAEPFGSLEWYQSGAATSTVTEEEEEAFDWNGIYIVTAGEVVMANNSYACPETFEMEIKYDDSYIPEYVITKFFGQNLVTEFNQYGWGWSSYPAENEPNQLDIDLSLANVLDESGTLGLFEKEGNAGNLALKVENGVVQFDDFEVRERASKALVATYKNVTAVKKGSTTGIENAIVEKSAVEGIFDLLGRKLDAITAPGLYIVNGKKVLVK